MNEKDFDRIREFLPTPEQIVERLGDELLQAEESLRKPKFIGLYILEGHEPVPVYNTIDWARWFEDSDHRKLAQDEINGWRVSTVFLGIDNAASYLIGGIPLLFETMVFSLTQFSDSPVSKHKFPRSLDTMTKRYATWNEAIVGHQETIALIREGAI